MRKLTMAGINAAARAEELRAAIEESEAAIEAAAEEEAAALRENDKAVAEVKALADYIENLVRGGEDQALVTVLKEELAELESQQREAAQRLERLRAHTQALRDALKSNAGELASVEQRHRQINDQAMKLREHIEKVVHRESDARARG
ncbi:MAG TPA: hypothetical protein VFB33_01395 [Candidatus Binataceae bacterium]|nr:hypothetical protein [Candidatus Binataceae bacterium]